MLASAFTGAKIGGCGFMAGARVAQRQPAAARPAAPMLTECAHKKGAGSTKVGAGCPPAMQQWAQRGAATACVPLRGDTEPSMAAAWPSCLRPPPGCLC
jgi:hypothetical protein